MKKIYSLLAAAALTMGFTACEDIPSPYEIIDEIIGGEAEDIYYESTGLYTGWSLVAVGDNQPWSQGSSYTQATGYQKWDASSDNKSNKEVKGYLISPSFKTTAESGKVRFSFDNTVRYTNNVKDWENNHRIYVSADYVDGGDFDAANWELIDWKSTASPYSDWTVYTSGNIALPEKYVNKENVHVAFYFYAPASSSTTWELMNFVIEEGEADYVGTGFNPGDNGGNDTPSAEAAGSGTKDDPYNVSAAIKFANGLAADTNSDPIYIKGKVASFKSGEEPGNQYGNATFYISDDGTDSNTFYCFRVMGPGNKKWTSADQLKVGDEVVIYGPVVNYKGNTLETVGNSCYVYSINGKVEEGGGTDTPTPSGEAKGSGTEADPFNVAGVLAFGKAGNYSNDNLSKEVYVKGIISNVASFTEKYGNINYYISEDGKTGGEEFYVYGGLGLNGAKFTSINELHVGAEVVVAGQVTIYNGTVEFTHSSKIISITNNEGGGGTVTPDDPVIGGSAENGDFETWSGGLPTHWKSTTSASNASLKQSTDAHGGKYAVECGNATSNKRLAYKELTLEAGEYTMTFWTKAANSSATSSIRPGYAIVVDGKISGGDDYKYGDYVNDIANEWQKVTYTFTLSEQTTVNVLVMISKNAKGAVLIDDFVLAKGDAKIISSRRRVRK